MSLLVPLVHRLAFLGQPEQSDCISDEFAFHFLVQRAIRCETRTVIHLKKIRLGLLVEHDIKAQNLEAHRILKVIQLALLESLRNDRLSANQGLHYYVFHLFHQSVRFYAIISLDILE